MAAALRSLLLLLAAAVAAALTPSAAASGGASLLNQLAWIPSAGGCRGTIAECLAGEEFELDSEVSRRILSANRYISYGALTRDTPPCSHRGASYYNCRPGAQAYPYTRGCSAISHCRSGG